MVMGSPLYGISFLLEHSYAHDVGSPTCGPGAEGPYSHNPGTLDNTEGLYSSSQRLGGVMVWDLVFDNPQGGACPRFHMLTNLVCGLMHCFRQAEVLLSDREHQEFEPHCDHFKLHISIEKSL
ncbi:hypothetical protein B566_EDAN015639 [Ephemera danica]|nr:hypothetical protein B566_EDAN015639 [Ephemera danica]